ncbi:MAG: hypothetical protein ACK5OI_09715, partial [Curvibacter sp.]
KRAAPIPQSVYGFGPEPGAFLSWAWAPRLANARSALTAMIFLNVMTFYPQDNERGNIAVKSLCEVSFKFDNPIVIVLLRA